MSYVGGPEEEEQAEPAEPRTDVVAAPSRARPTPWATPLGIFVGVLVLGLLTFGSSVALLTRVAPLGSPDEETGTLAPTRTATPAATPIRITAAAATAERLDTGAYRVTFSWTLDGARQGDTALLRFSMGSRVISEQRGALDANLFASSSGKFTVTTSQECSTDGWSAEVVSIRGLTPVGEPISRAPGVSCS